MYKIERFIYIEVLLIYMIKDINYKELYERIQKGERDIEVAFSVSKSVSTLYSRFSELGLIKTKTRINTEQWTEQYELHKLGKTITAIERDLNVSRGTVYNNFYKLKLITYKPYLKTRLNKEDFYKNAKTLNNQELAIKYNLTMTYVRSLIKKNQRQAEALN